MQSIVVTLDISLELYAELGEYLSVSSVHFFSNEIPTFVALSVPFTCWLSADVLANKFIPKLEHRKSKYWRARSRPSAPSKELHVVLAQKLRARQVVILSITLCFLLGSRCPASGFCLAASLCHHGKERSIPLVSSLPPSKGRKAVRMLPCPCLSRAATVVGSSPKMTQEIFYLLQLCSVTLIIRGCLSFVCITQCSPRETFSVFRNPMLGLALI